MWECCFNYFGWWFACLGRLHQPLIKPAYSLLQVFSCFSILASGMRESITQSYALSIWCTHPVIPVCPLYGLLYGKVRMTAV